MIQMVVDWVSHGESIACSFLVPFIASLYYVRMFMHGEGDVHMISFCVWFLIFHFFEI